MDEVTIRTLEGFVKYIEENFDDQSEHLFRGQPEDWELLPTIARGKHHYHNLLEAEERILDEFRQRSVPFLQGAPSNLWDWMVLGQHHGLPTRLLDWSLNPLAALWFAVRNAPTPNRNGVVWALSQTDTDRASEKVRGSLPSGRYYVLAPTHLSNRIAAQMAWCTVHKHKAEAPHFRPLEQSTQLGGKLKKIIIPSGQFAHLRFHLTRSGVHHASITPGLDGLCQHISWKFFCYADEGACDDPADRPR